jgi:hypothetical protein
MIMSFTRVSIAIVFIAMVIGSCRELAQTAYSSCTSEPTGAVFAAFENESDVDVLRITGTVKSVTPKGESYHDRIVVATGGRRTVVLFSAPDRQLPVVESQEYTFEIQHKPGWPTACSIIVSDDKGMLFAGATDWSLGANVLPNGPAGFKLGAAPEDCESRPHNSCYESVTNTALDVSLSGESVTLFHGESRRLAGYEVTCLTSQAVVYTSDCADAGLTGVSYMIERAKD